MDTAIRPFILVVEDHADAARSLAVLLRHHGYDVFLAGDASEAVGSLKVAEPVAVILDIGLPGADGYEVARQVCAAMRKKPLLIALTGFLNLEARSQQEGFDHHLLKPAEPQDLVELVRVHALRRAMEEGGEGWKIPTSLLSGFLL